MLTLEQKDQTMLKRARERAEAFNHKVEQERRIKNLTWSVQSQCARYAALEAAHNELKRALNSEMADKIKREACVRLSKAIVDKFIISAAELFEAKELETMLSVLNYCCSTLYDKIPPDIVTCFDNVIELMEYELEASMNMQTRDITLKSSVYWSNRDVFITGFALPGNPKRSLSAIRDEYIGSE